MKYKNHLRYFVFFGIIFVIVYIFASVNILPLEFQFKPVSSVQLQQKDASSLQNAENKIIYPFKNDYWAGYCDGDGNVLMSIALKDNANAQNLRATLSQKYFATYTTNSSQIDVIDALGNKQTIINAEGFPFFKDDSLFLLPAGGNSVAKYGTTGERTWIYEHIAPVTALNSSQKGTVIGFADGNLVLVGNDGSEKFSFYPGGSNYQVILGADIAPTQNLVACLSGIDKQRFVLISYGEHQQKVLFHTYLNGNVKHQSLVQFTSDSRAVFFQQKNALGVLDCKTMQLTRIPIKGAICQIQEIPSLNASVVLTRNNNDWYIYLLENNNKLAGNYHFDAKTAGIVCANGNIFIARDNIFSKVQLFRN